MGQSRLHGWMVPAVLFIIAFLIVLDQALRSGIVWQWHQVLHHETIALILISIAVGMLISQALSSISKTG